MGIFYDNIAGIIYTVSEDKTFRTIDKTEVVTNGKIDKLEEHNIFINISNKTW